MGQLFGRTLRLTLGTTLIECIDSANAGLAVTFRVKKNLKPEPNTVDISVFNLSAQTRKSIEQPAIVPVKLEVGYRTEYFTIFLGELHSAHSHRLIGTGSVETKIASGDKEQQIAGGRALIQVPSNASPQQILTLAAQGMGIALGNVSTAPATATMGGPARTLHGSASRIFGNVVRSSGLEWSVQDGALQVLPRGGFARPQAMAVRLSADSGMVGEPTVDSKGILSVTSLIQPDLNPGLPLVVEGAFLQGSYRIEEVEYEGDTHGTAWYAHIKGRKWA